MDVVGSEIGQKMRSAIKAKLTELGCYVDDELPDYVMVMVANKRTRLQMEDDLQLFLGDNTELFVNWLHQVLKKLQEVTVTAPLVPEREKSREKSKEKKAKDKKVKDKNKIKKTEIPKKGKKKHKEKTHRKKEEKKTHKSKKKNKHHEMIHPNVPPLLMNIEKVSEPSITDVFAGQILKKHGVTIESPKKDEVIDIKPIIKEKRPILPIIDPATIPSQSEPESSTDTGVEVVAASSETDVVVGAPREEQIKEINEIEAKIQGLKQKLAEQLDSMSDDEDFLNIRTEAEELMNDFAEDVFQEISAQTPAVATPPIQTRKSPSPPSIPEKPPTPPIRAPSPPPKPKETPKEPEELPQIELKLPKRPIRERLGAREEKSAPEKVPRRSNEEKKAETPERFTPDREPDFWGKNKPSKSRAVITAPTAKRDSLSDESSDKSDDQSSRRVTSTGRTPSCASVVLVKPRPRSRPARAPASSLLMRAVADAHKSLLNIPPKVENDPGKVKRALVLPMRRCVDAQKIVIQVPTGHDKSPTDEEKDEYVPTPLTKKFINSDYVPSRFREERTTTRRDDTLVIETINIHNTTVDKDKETQFIVTMDGFNPNAFLAKKLMTEGILNDDDEIKDKVKTNSKTVLKNADNAEKIDKYDKENSPKDKIVEENTSKVDKQEKHTTEKHSKENSPKDKQVKESSKEKHVKEIPKDNAKENSPKDNSEKEDSPKAGTETEKKRFSETSEDSDTQVIIKKDTSDKRKSETELNVDGSTAKKRKASPIVFDVEKKDGGQKRERTESASSDGHVVVSTTSSSKKYDSIPPLSAAAVPPPPAPTAWCRSFPLCRFGASCAFAHPRCKFLASCTRRDCPYSHKPAAITAPRAHVTTHAIASHVVPSANFKSISSASPPIPNICKFYPKCANPACHFYHPKPCRYGKACLNKIECNFYHGNDSLNKWRYPPL